MGYLTEDVPHDPAVAVAALRRRRVLVDLPEAW
jgi:hypothetical protein